MRGERPHYGEEWFATHGLGVEPDVALEFAQLVAPLRAPDGRPLNGPMRTTCLRAFREQPEGFRRLVEEALARGSRNPVGLLVRMVQAGEYLDDEVS